MIVTLAFLALLMAVFVGWLLSRSVNVHPWVAEAAGEQPARAEPPSFTPGRVGLAVFMAVMTSIFALCISAYMMRMEIGSGWQALPEPGVLWFNTAMLVAASIALQWAWNAARHDRRRTMRTALVLGGVLTVVFIGGQYAAWQQLVGAGYYMSSNPANAFFYLLTALHALHLLGGLGAVSGTLVRVLGGAGTGVVRANIELCAVYWHALLLIWLVLFALLLQT